MGTMKRQDPGGATGHAFDEIAEIVGGRGGKPGCVGGFRWSRRWSTGSTWAALVRPARALEG
jgi:hypothetical protein